MSSRLLFANVITSTSDKASVNGLLTALDEICFIAVITNFYKDILILKVECFQFGLLPCLMWPITVYKVTLSHAKQLERMVSTQLKQWFGFPRCLSNIGLYRNEALYLSNLVV